MANIITSFRILCSIALLFCTALSPLFYAFYLTAGLSDIADGWVARKTKTVSEFGSKFDTVADVVFVAVCLYKLLPVMALPVWIYVWIGVVAAVKIFNVVYGFVRQKKFVAVHSLLNKATGLLLFLLPFTFPFVDVKYSDVVVCVLVTVAAVWELFVCRKAVITKEE